MFYYLFGWEIRHLHTGGSCLGAVAGVRRRIRRDEDTSSGLASLRTSELLLRIAGVRRNEAPRRNESPYSLRGHRRTAHA